jgi:mono/diheme cytochrome c family protein
MIVPMLMVLMLMAAVQLPDAPGRPTVQKVCGACHGMDVIVAKGRGRDEWEQVIASMVSRGAKATDAELGQVLNYLATNLPPKAVEASAGARQAPPRRKGIGAGAADAHVVDEVSAARGRTIYGAECLECHGPKSRGTDKGPDLVRSLVVLHDRYGSTIGPFLAKGHPLQSGGASSAFTHAQIADISNFLHQSVEDTLRSGPYNQVINVMTGDAQAGEAYFNGAGKCSGCHSPSGDLAGIAKKFDPPNLQQRFLFPQRAGFSGGHVMSAKPLTVTVTTPDGQAVSGRLISMDDFSVALQDSEGAYRSWKRTPALKVEEHNPYEAHEELLDQYTDKDIHNLLAYLETLK